MRFAVYRDVRRRSRVNKKAYIEREWIAAWGKWTNHMLSRYRWVSRDAAEATAQRRGGKIVRLYTREEMLDRAAALVLISEAAKFTAMGMKKAARFLLHRAELLAHCPCKGHDKAPGPHSKCCPLRDPNYARRGETF